MKRTNSRGKQIAVLLAALLSVSMLTACNGNSENGQSSASLPTESSAAADESSSATDESSTDSSEESSSHADSTSSNTDESSVITTDTENKTSTQTTQKSTGTSAAKPNDNHSQTTAAKQNQTPVATTHANSPQQQPQGGNQPTTTPAPQDPDEPEVKEIKYIYLNGSSAQYNGSGITVQGSKITISKGGTYVISGTLSNGQIYIMTDDKKVRLQLNNCSITNNAGSAINCQQAKKVTLETLAGTNNSLSDGGTHDTDKGTVFSEDTVVLTGEGTLNIKANYAHGIQSDDDIVMNGGTVKIQSAKSCLHSNDGIEINGGSLYCDGGTNGIKTDGYINITGGDSTFIGGNREEKGAIYCDGAFAVTGGTFRAIGNTCAKPNSTATTVPVIGAIFSATQPAETPVRFISGGAEIAAFTSPRTFKYALYAGANLAVGKEYSVEYGSSNGGIFTSSGNVTLYNVPLT